jgi:hypothetical protein
VSGRLRSSHCSPRAKACGRRNRYAQNHSRA